MQNINYQKVSHFTSIDPISLDISTQHLANVHLSVHVQTKIILGYHKYYKL